MYKIDDFPDLQLATHFNVTQGVLIDKPFLVIEGSLWVALVPDTPIAIKPANGRKLA